MTILYGKKADEFMMWFRWQVEKGTLPSGTTIDAAIKIYEVKDDSKEINDSNGEPGTKGISEMVKSSFTVE